MTEICALSLMHHQNSDDNDDEMKKLIKEAKEIDTRCKLPLSLKLRYISEIF